eukprot:279515-Rhodomonas_salina.1
MAQEPAALGEQASSLTRMSSLDDEDSSLGSSSSVSVTLGSDMPASLLSCSSPGFTGSPGSRAQSASIPSCSLSAFGGGGGSASVGSSPVQSDPFRTPEPEDQVADAIFLVPLMAAAMYPGYHEATSWWFVNGMARATYSDKQARATVKGRHARMQLRWPPKLHRYRKGFQ